MYKVTFRMVLMGFRGCPLTDVRRKRSNDDMLMLERWPRDQENLLFFQGNPVQFLAPTSGSDSISRGCNALFWPPWALYACHTHTHKQALTDTHKYCKRLNIVEQR